MNKSLPVELYESACIDLVLEFIEKYYGEDSRWDGQFIGGEIGGVVEIGNEFWHVHDIYLALKLDAPEKTLFKWHNSYTDGATRVNLQHYLRGVR